jgi:regulatory protein
MSTDAAFSAEEPESRRGRSDPTAQTARSGKSGFTLSLKGRALRLLAGREYSRAELERKLAPHEETPGQLAQVLDELQAKDFISEARVVESVINRRQAKLGLARIKQELLGKGLGKEAVLDAMAGLKATELERARALWQKSQLRMQRDGPNRCGFWPRAASAAMSSGACWRDGAPGTTEASAF